MEKKRKRTNDSVRQIKVNISPAVTAQYPGHAMAKNGKLKPGHAFEKTTGRKNWKGSKRRKRREEEKLN